jgi:transposase
VLEGANIKLASVVSDVMGVSGRAMLAALLEGRQTPAQIAELAKGQLRKKQAELSRALEGVLQPHQRFMVVELLVHIDYLEEAIARLDAEVGEQTRPFEAELERLDSIPGVNRRVAEVLAAEVGVDMKPFVDAERLAAWAGSVRATRPAPGNATAAKRAKGVPGCGGRWPKPRMVPPGKRTNISRRSITDWPGGAARNGPPSQWTTAF